MVLAEIELNFGSNGSSLAEAKKLMKLHALGWRCALDLYVKFNIGESGEKQPAMNAS